MKSNNEIKKNLRKECTQLRKKIYERNLNIFNIILFNDLFKKINFNNIKVISSFLSINTEINTSELNSLIINKNKILCLPVVENQYKHLVFRQHFRNDELIEGQFKIMEPPKENKILEPDLLFVPCLAFDKMGYRLGYGGGFYDKTFGYYNKINKKYISVGYAFDDQQIEEIPIDNFDIKLDYVITEKNLYHF